VISVIRVGARGAQRAFSLCWLLMGLGCGKLVGGVVVEREGAADASTSTGQDPLRPGQTACRAGVVRCQGPMLQTCEADGSGWRPLQRCDSAALCVDSAGEQSRCLEAACEPGITCDGSELRQCNMDRTGFDPIESCLSAAHCDPMAGACERESCVPGEITCNGATLQRCNGGPSGHDPLATCATAALCDDLVQAACGDDTQNCQLGGAPVCPEPVCEAGALRCTGARLEVCNAGRNGWDFVDACVTPGVCELTRSNPAAINCVEPLCDVGDVICSPLGARLACSDDRTAYSTPISQCQSAAECTPQGCEAGSRCTPGALSCNGTTLLECQLDAAGQPVRVAVDECATRQLCELSLSSPQTTPASCREPVCAPGEFACAGRQMQSCNAARTDFVNHQLCATDALCGLGAGVGACPAPCSGAACNGSMLRLCNAELTRLVDVEDCGTPAECDSVQGRCADPCVVGALRCNGNALERCESPLSGWQRLQTCDTAGLCQLSVEQEQTTCSARRCTPGQHRCSGQRLEVCNEQLTDFTLVATCAAGEICDAPSQQCDRCVADAVACSGNQFSRCSSNGQALSVQQCQPGLCSAAAPNVGCLECSTPNGFRCDNQGSLFQCSADQRREDQLAVCRTPQLCRANLGQCLECDPVGSSRCAGAEVRGCSAQNTESVLDECASADLCQPTGPTSAACQDSACEPSSIQCTLQGEVLSCNAGQTGYVAQSPPVFCATPALCDATVPGGCQAPACGEGERQCSANVVQVCNDARTGFRAETTCNTGGGFACVENATSATCACNSGEYRCVAGQGLSQCNAQGSAFVDVGADFACDGAARLSCSGTTLASEACESAAHCQASGCAACLGNGDCDDGSFCNGQEVCSASGACVAGAPPCPSGQLCSETSDACAQCFEGDDCPAGQTCIAGACIGTSPDGGT
jgi:hypothetical protein